MNTTKVLVIDDEPDIRELLSLTFTRMGLLCDVASHFQEAITLLEKHHYALVLTDMYFPEGDGCEIVRYIQKNKPETPVAVITAFGNVEHAVNTLKAGAFDYVSKPLGLEKLKVLVNTALKMQSIEKVRPNELLIGESDVMQSLRSKIDKLARTQAPIFIQGPSGVGKELVARSIHLRGPRHDKPFIPVNCGAIPSELMESEFFGHKKGSFTGAVADKQGLFVAANGGTLFLDEIAELPLAMQVKLLRAIQEKAVKPVGEWGEIAVDVRILSASNKNLLEEVKAQRFREELYYRINVIELHVPSLQERKEDIPLLTTHILEKLSKDQKRGSMSISSNCMEFLKQYAFPGNVRELENILEGAMAMCTGRVIEKEDLNLSKPLAEPKQEIIEKTAGDLEEQLQSHEKELILSALEKTKWNRTAAAKILGLSFRTLRYRLKKLGI